LKENEEIVLKTFRAFKAVYEKLLKLSKLLVSRCEARELEKTYRELYEAFVTSSDSLYQY
jgi:hypothetical protein